MEKRWMKSASFWLVIINSVIFLGLSVIGSLQDAGFMVRHGGMYIPLVLEKREYYRLFTSMFLHFNAIHLINNMVGLLAMGSQLEKEVGRVKLLLLYLGSGLVGNGCSMWFNLWKGEFPVSAGASGCVFGLFGGLLYVVIRNNGWLRGVSGRRLLFVAMFSVYMGYSEGGVDNAAHIGGLAGGFILGILLYRKNRKGRDREDEKRRLYFL